MGEGDNYLLIVDDQAGVRRLLCEAFIEEGYQVEEASGGADALKKIERALPDLVLLDIKMPLMNGLETLREIKKISSALPVVMMTAYGELEMIQEARSMGVTHYLVKPFDLNEVRRLVKSLLDEKRQKYLNKEIV